MLPVAYYSSVLENSMETISKEDRAEWRNLDDKIISRLLDALESAEAAEAREHQCSMDVFNRARQFGVERDYLADICDRHLEAPFIFFQRSGIVNPDALDELDKPLDWREFAKQEVKRRKLVLQVFDLIRRERRRQIEEKGWSREHDLMHDHQELAWAASYYLMPYSDETCVYADLLYEQTGWDRAENRRGDKSRVRQLVIGASLLAAEIERLSHDEYLNGVEKIYRAYFDDSREHITKVKPNMPHDNEQLAWAACYFAMPRRAVYAGNSFFTAGLCFEQTGWDGTAFKRRIIGREEHLVTAGVFAVMEIVRIVGKDNLSVDQLTE
jgi:hypothetical protein